MEFAIWVRVKRQDMSAQVARVHSLELRYICQYCFRRSVIEEEDRIWSSIWAITSLERRELTSDRAPAGRGGDGGIGMMKEGGAPFFSPMLSSSLPLLLSSSFKEFGGVREGRLGRFEASVPRDLPEGS